MITIEEMEDFVEKGEEGRNECPTEKGPEQLPQTVDQLVTRNQPLSERVELLERLVKMSPAEGKHYWHHIQIQVSSPDFQPLRV